MFRASSAHLQEVTVVHMQHMVLSLSMIVPGGLSVHSLSDVSYTLILYVRFEVVIVVKVKYMTFWDGMPYIL